MGGYDFSSSGPRYDDDAYGDGCEDLVIEDSFILLAKLMNL